MKSTSSSCMTFLPLFAAIWCGDSSTRVLVQMNRKPPVVVVENELLAGRGAVEPELAPRDDLGARPGAQPLCLRPSVEGLERDVYVLELLGDGRHVQGGPAACPVRVVDRDRDLRSCGEVARAARTRPATPTASRSHRRNRGP